MFHDIFFVLGESGDEYIDEEFVAEEYGVCQPAAYDSEEYNSHSEVQYTHR